MSLETSAGTGKRYGPERVCRVLEFARSTIYAQRVRALSKVVPLSPQRRRPKPKVSDAGLLAAIRTDLGIFHPLPVRVIAWSGPGCASCGTFVSPARTCCA
jgi:hypothetical protein